MRRPGGPRPPARLNLLAALLATAAATAAGAQPVYPPATELPPSPVAKPPVESPFSNADPRPTPTPTAADGDVAGASIRAVRVIADAPGAMALPPDGWVPPEDGSGISAIQHSDRQPLDARWVQQQFDRATASGPIRPSAAVGLIQLINRAFITAGFINSGLLVLNGPNAGTGAMDVRLVYGKLASGGAGDAPVAIEWGGGDARGLTPGYVLANFPSTSAQPLNALELERDFRLLDESAGIRSISAALQPGQKPGEATLRLIVYPADRFDFYTGVANDRSPAVGGDHVFAGGFMRNLFTGGDVLSGEGGWTRGVEDGQLGYSTPLFNSPVSFNTRVAFNNAAVITSALVPLDIRAKDRSGEFGFAYQIIHAPLMMRGANKHWSPSESLVAGLSVVARQQKSYLLGEPFSFAPGSRNGRSEYEGLRLSADYIRRDLNRVIALSVSATRGFDGTRSDVPGIPNPHQHFIAALGQLNVAQRIGGGFELRGRLTGQMSRGILYSGLRLAVGGANSVRGYRESLFLVDRGIIGTIELARTFNLGGESRANGFAWGAFTASVFADAAAFKNAGAPQPDEHRIGSLGASLAWTPSDAIRASITYGHALNDFQGSGNKSLQDRGIHFRVIVHPAGLF